jgi:dihydroneopterin triphosphate diphosphatase
VRIRDNMISCYVTRPGADAATHEFLQLRRSQGDFMGGTWQAVYGQSQDRETPVTAVLRELREETGLIPAELYRLDRVAVFYVALEDTLWHCIPFCAIVTRGQEITLNDEHDAFRWVQADEAAKLFMWQDNRDALQSIQNEILTDSLAKPYLRIPLPADGEC